MNNLVYNADGRSVHLVMVDGQIVVEDHKPLFVDEWALAQKVQGIGPSGNLDLAELLTLSEDEFRARFQGTSIMRAKRGGLQKNACVAMGNERDAAGVPALVSALKDAEPLVRGHAAWALGQIATAEAIKSLEQSTVSETNYYVLEEIQTALNELRQRPAQSS